MLPALPIRKPDSHKGDYGRALLIGGSRGMAGAISLSGLAALRAGAGLVTIATADAALDTVASFDPCYMTVPLPDEPDGSVSFAAKERLQQLAQSADCIAVGPGMRNTQQTQRLVKWLFESAAAPLVLDADGLNALSVQPAVLSSGGGPRILTPHPGEFARLTSDKQPADETAAASFAKKHGIVLVLKGNRTLVTDGTESYRNETGNPGMATGGSGDVLTGVICALICQGLSPIDAAKLGVYLHGQAGDLGARDLGQAGMTARDIIGYLPRAWIQYQQRVLSRQSKG